MLLKFEIYKSVTLCILLILIITFLQSSITFCLTFTVHRIQLMFPLHFLGMVNRFDLQCFVNGGGPSGQSGAIRLAIARALRSFLDEDAVEKMRQGK